MRIEDMLAKDIKYEKFLREDPKCSPMQAKECNDYRSKINEYKSKTYKFEKRVLVHLFENRHDLGIEKIYELKNMRVDAALKLDSGKIVLLEIKYALNWRNCCNARVEVERFVGEELFRTRAYHKHISEEQPQAALIIFEHFSGDWEKIRRVQNHKHESGWSYFYEEEEILRKKFPTMPMCIAQLTKEGVLKGAPQI